MKNMQDKSKLSNSDIEKLEDKILSKYDSALSKEEVEQRLLPEKRITSKVSEKDSPILNFLSSIINPVGSMISTSKPIHAAKRKILPVFCGISGSKRAILINIIL